MIEFAIRPEDMKIASTGLEAKIKLTEPLGAHLLATCEVDGGFFRAILDSDSAVKLGDVIHLAPQLDRIRWFDTKTGNSVE